MGFVSPDSIVKPSPSIRNLVKDQPVAQLPPATPPLQVPPAVAPQTQNQLERQSATQAPVAPQSPLPPTEQMENQSAPPQSPTPTSPAAPQQTAAPSQGKEGGVMPSFIVGSEKYNEAFLSCWNEMIDIVFEDVQTLRIPLHNYPVEVNDNVARVILRNQFQMDDFAMKKNAVLQYLRSHFDERINDVIPEMDTTSEAKKYILDEKDKLEVLRQENPDIVDFMQTLNLRLKN
ncbi:MAG: hypothetical protein MJZ49_00905 [Bacteroidales bacterium]|nr:hypothetical protein [Bacteroidales bacterium]